MLHFLVEKHRSCHHLLASGEFDAVGCNYNSLPRYFSGNFFWATSSYIASQGLRSLSLLHSDKYDAEQWVLSGQRARVFIAHVSGIDHSHTRYPRSQYTPVRSMKSESTVDPIAGASASLYSSLSEHGDDASGSATSEDKGEGGDSVGIKRPGAWCMGVELM